MAQAIKDYLGSENARNKAHAALYSELIKRAFGNCNVLVGHHLTFEFGEDLNTENEIPSADCLMFDHTIMKAVFGDDYKLVMRQLVSEPVETRDALLAEHLELQRKRETARVAA